MQRTGRYEPPPELQKLEASGVFDLGHAFGPESRPLTRAGSRPATRPGTPGGASRGGTMHLASLQAIIGQPSNMQHLPERPGSAVSNSSMQRPKTSRGKPGAAHAGPQTTGTLSSSFAGRFPSSSATVHRPRVSSFIYISNFDSSLIQSQWHHMQQAIGHMGLACACAARAKQPPPCHHEITARMLSQ